jgi:predicted transcriptional regulator
VVALLEQLRQDSPHLRDRVDELAEAMSQQRTLRAEGV